MEITDTGLVLATIHELLELRLVHFISAVDVDPTELPVEHRCGTPTTVTGYTEWVSHAEFPITVGWDWSMLMRGRSVHWQREELPRTNVQLLSEDGHALAWEASLRVLATWVDAQTWQKEVAMAVCVV